MVNSVSYPGPAAADMGPKAGTGGGQPVHVSVPTHTPQPAPQRVEKAPIPVPDVAAMTGSSQPLVDPLTSLALWTDSASGMQVAVVRDRVSGKVVEQFPTERALRLAAMVRQQEVVAQELQIEQAGTPRVDLKT